MSDVISDERSDVKTSSKRHSQSKDFTAYQLKKRKARIWWLIIPVLVLSAGFMIWLVWFSQVFAVKEFRVVGSSEEILSAEQIAQVQETAKIKLDDRIATLDTDAAAQAVVGLSWVSAVEVRRGWPNEVVVALELRIPLARVEGVDASQGVDAQGIIFDHANLEGLPLIQASGGPLVAAVQVVVAMPENLAKKVVRISANSIDSIEIDLKSGSTVKWGSADEPEFKAAVLNALLSRRAQVYDVSAPELPTTTDEKGRKKS